MPSWGDPLAEIDGHQFFAPKGPVTADQIASLGGSPAAQGSTGPGTAPRFASVGCGTGQLQGRSAAAPGSATGVPGQSSLADLLAKLPHQQTPASQWPMTLGQMLLFGRQGLGGMLPQNIQNNGLLGSMFKGLGGAAAAGTGLRPQQPTLALPANNQASLQGLPANIGTTPADWAGTRADYIQDMQQDNPALYGAAAALAAPRSPNQIANLQPPPQLSPQQAPIQAPPRQTPPPLIQPPVQAPVTSDMAGLSGGARWASGVAVCLMPGKRNAKRPLTGAERIAKLRINKGRNGNPTPCVSPPGLLTKLIPRHDVEIEELEKSAWATMEIYDKLLCLIEKWMDGLGDKISETDGFKAFALMTAALESITIIRGKIIEQRGNEAQDVTAQMAENLDPPDKPRPKIEETLELMRRRFEENVKPKAN